MYTQSFLTTSDRGIGPLPTTAANSELTFNGFINALLGFAMYFLNYFMRTHTWVLPTFINSNPRPPGRSTPAHRSLKSYDVDLFVYSTIFRNSWHRGYSLLIR